MILPQKLAHKLLKKSLVIFVNPRDILFNVGSDRPITNIAEQKLKEMGGYFLPFRVAARLLSALHPFILTSSQFPELIPLQNIPKYIKVYDYFHHLPDFENSLWYNDMINKLRYGHAKHKNIKLTTETEVKEFFTGYVNVLIEKLSKEGYNLERDSQLPTAMICANGKIHKADGGNHRFAIAQCIGLQRFPLLIKCVHADWLKAKGNFSVLPNLTSLAASLKEVQEEYDTLQ